MVRAVGTRVESVEIRMLGPLSVRRNAVAQELPASRKVRALLAYLAVAPRAVTRSQLCDLLWDLPSDPRGELRWSLSKIRALLDDEGHPRVHTQGDTVNLNLRECFVDAIEVASATQAVDTIDPERLRALAALFAGDFLDGLDVEHCPAFSGWLTAQRRRFRSCHAALLERLVKSVPDDEAFEYLEKWLELSPLDPHVHELLMRALARRNRHREGEEHLAAAAALFEAEGMDGSSLRDAWRDATSANVAVEIRNDGAGVVEAEPHRASVAIMPFANWSVLEPSRGTIADALAHDTITKLAKLRSLFVIAQGTVFALHERRIGAEEAGRMLNVDYIASGSVRTQGDELSVTVELSETRTARIIWAEVFHIKRDDAFQILDEIANSIVASIASEIEASERNRAVLRPPNSLDAWQAHHRGLWHMYRFNKADNERAQYFFEMAVRLDPTFARAYAGLSFTHFQNAFQSWVPREAEIERANDAARQSVIIDDRDPAAHWAMGRALWLRKQHDQSVTELQESIDLSPNFALGHYTLAFVHSQSGDPDVAISCSERARRLSPFDPLVFAMLASRAMALARAGRFDEAAHVSLQAAARPNAHAHILGIAAFCLALDGRLDEARTFIAAIRRTSPNYGTDDFMTAFHFDPEGAKLFGDAAKRMGLS